MSGFFIAGTGTDVGKTFVTCALIHATGRRAYKPVVTGFTETGDSDTRQLISAMGRCTLDEISPWRFSAALAPDMAAAREEREIPFYDLVKWSRERDGFIEGVGGVMVPLTERHNTLDWMAALAWPVMLVCGSYLGSLSHTLTALSVLRAARLDVTLLILNESAGSPVPLTQTKRTLERHAGIPVIAQPRVASYREATEIHAVAATWI